MSSGVEIIILLVVTAVLLVRLIGQLGRRDGFEPENRPLERPQGKARDQIIDAQDDFDLDHYGEDPKIKKALMDAKRAEPDFRVDEFLTGSKAAYEMILMSFLNGDMSQVAGFVDPHVLDGFQAAIEERRKDGQSIEAEFVGIKNVELRSADYNSRRKELTLGVDYTAELIRVVKDKDGKIIHGGKNKVETEFDHWQFARVMGSDDPNWTLVATGD